MARVPKMQEQFSASSYTFWAHARLHGRSKYSSTGAAAKMQF
jgi:hypothetical protein